MKSIVNTVICHFSHASGTGELGEGMYSAFRGVNKRTRSVLSLKGRGILSAKITITSGIASGALSLTRGTNRLGGGVRAGTTRTGGWIRI